MGWSFNLHGGIAAGLSALLLILAALTWLPGTLPSADSTWLTAAVVVLLFPICTAAPTARHPDTTGPLAIPSLLFASAACLALAAGELRRADAAPGA